MTNSRSRKRNSNSRGSAGKVLALLFVILACVAAVYFCVKYKDRLIPERETIEVQTETAAPVEDSKPDEEQPKANEIETLPVVEKETEPEYKPEITLTFAGDILFDPNYAIMASMLQRGGDIATSFDQELMDIMTGSDVFMLNNEFPYSDRGTPLPEKQFTFRTKNTRQQYNGFKATDDPQQKCP